MISAVLGSRTIAMMTGERRLQMAARTATQRNRPGGGELNVEDGRRRGSRGDTTLQRNDAAADAVALDTDMSL